MMPVWVERLDHWFFFVLNHGLATPLLDHLFWWVSAVGSGVPLVVATGAVLWVVDRRRCKRHYLWLVAAVLVGALAVQLLKYAIARPRPLAEFAALLQAGTVHVNVIGPPLRRRSFPSGHTQATAAVFTYLTCLYPRRWPWWGSGTLLVGLSRIYVGVHFPADVLAGALLGSLLAVGTWRLQGFTVRPGPTAPPGGRDRGT